MRRDPPPDHWTPDLVEARLIEAIRFARAVAGRAGPAGIGSGMPIFTPTMEDFLEEGWGLPDPPEEDEGEDVVTAYSPEAATRLLGALEWVADLLAPGHPNRARAVNAWVRSSGIAPGKTPARCRALKRPRPSYRSRRRRTSSCAFYGRCGPVRANRPGR